ncbi:hypothetical protein FOZ61_002142 [Perkinsus olseni]|uniref:Selenoprotein T n=1 Tax=Perkinsus olseni TaxID=32597 RepID=A0A7J6LUA1_PEROL|nr:hypothetical protein FOZ61_002142 [Perkinsus olseni]KAF4668464.1 hypothetical protein FOL46_001961 [Perkinsus olseni]
MSLPSQLLSFILAKFYRRFSLLPLVLLSFGLASANPVKPDYFRTALQGEDIPHRAYLDSLMPEDQITIQYPIPDSVMHISRLVGMLQLFMMAMIFFGDTMCGFMGIPTPDLVKNMQDNKFTAFFAVYFIGSTIQGILMNTGAFEIYKGNTLIWSTLQAGRLPKLNDIVAAFERQGVQFAF